MEIVTINDWINNVKYMFKARGYTNYGATIKTPELQSTQDKCNQFRDKYKDPWKAENEFTANQQKVLDLWKTDIEELSKSHKKVVILVPPTKPSSIKRKHNQIKGLLKNNLKIENISIIEPLSDDEFFLKHMNKQDKIDYLNNNFRKGKLNSNLLVDKDTFVIFVDDVIVSGLMYHFMLKFMEHNYEHFNKEKTIGLFLAKSVNEEYVIKDGIHSVLSDSEG